MLRKKINIYRYSYIIINLTNHGSDLTVASFCIIVLYFNTR